MNREETNQDMVDEVSEKVDSKAEAMRCERKRITSPLECLDLSFPDSSLSTGSKINDSDNLNCLYVDFIQIMRF